MIDYRSQLVVVTINITGLLCYTVLDEYTTLFLPTLIHKNST